MEFDTEDHYARIASAYDGNWAHNPDYVDWMGEQIARRLRVAPGDRVADIGAGTGLFLRALHDTVSAETPVVCIDPSEPMLAQLPDDPRLLPLRATAEQVATGTVPLPYDRLDAILIKEAIHHIEDIASTVHGLGRLLAPGGRFLVVSLPPLIDYPLFTEALERFVKRQPEPARIAEDMTAAGLRADVSHQEFAVRVRKDDYLEVVARRWMSVLSTFTDAELGAGLAEIRRSHPEDVLAFADRFAFICGTRPS